ncbi:nitrous oxide reductase accessory protein NosL [Terasakiella sp.]|uniref:nitrous oxide reductase accessory protein NosL n=1 Tax=Terasakiella sp. TaxID=2034861 RepID=UPI003AA918F5
MKKWLCLFLLPFLLLACNEEKTGPVDVHYDRDMCERCRMIISEPKFVAQVRGGPNKQVWKFDDIGDAVTWLNDKPWAGDKETEIWVMDYTSGTQWMDARSAYFVPGYLSPMAYGFAAFKAERPMSVDFKTMLEKVLKKKITINCDPLDPQHSNLTNNNKRRA